jgi:hypothetical protein
MLSLLLLGIQGVAQLLDLLLVLDKLLRNVIREQLREGLTLVCISVQELIILNLQVSGVLLEGFEFGVLLLDLLMRLLQFVLLLHIQRLLLK